MPVSPHEEQDPAKTQLLFALLFTTAVGPLLNHGLSAAAPIFIQELGISDGQFGLLSTVLFLSAACASLVMGRLADVLNSWTQLVINFGGTAVALVLTAISHSYAFLLIAVIIGGVCQVIANPTTNRIILRDVDSARRPMWIGLKQSGVQVSQVFAGVLVPATALIVGWTGAAMATALLAAALLGWSLRQIPPEPKTAWADVARELYAVLARKTRLARLPRYVWYMALAAFLAGTGTQATNVYLSLFAVTELGMSPLAGGLAIALTGALGIASRMWWSHLIGRGIQPSLILVYIALGSVLGMISMVTASTLISPTAYWIGVVLHGACVLGANVVITTAIIQSASNSRIGHASGAITMGMYAGFATGPIAMGLLVDGTGSFLAGWIATGLVYVVLTALVTGIALRRPEPRQ